jgi:two-component system, OmpR family, sensor histidine kinase QseC
MIEAIANASLHKRDFSLRTRLLVAMLSIVAVVWLLSAFASYAQARHELGELLDAHLATSAALLVAQASEELEEIELEHLPDLGDAHQRLALQVWSDGRLGVHSANAPNAPLAPFRHGFADVTATGTAWRVYSTRSREGDWVQVGEPVSARTDILREALARQAWPMLLALPLLGVGIWFVLGRGLSPLQRMAQVVGMRAPLDTTPIVADDAPREIRPLLDRLNALFARTGASIEREQRFIGDASHELRTPVAAIRAQAQVAQGARDDAERQRALAGVIAGCDRMTGLTDQLLTLSRLEAGVLSSATAHASIQTVAQDVLAEFAPLVRRQRARIALEIADDLRTDCGPLLLQIVLRNLVGNALQYGGDGVRIQLAASRLDNAVSLSVRDDGPGIAEEDRACALQRFDRLDAHAAGGAGLGLAIVQRIADAIGAELSLADGIDGRGLGVHLHLPDRHARQR